ncbi:MAG: AAA family ATPase [Eubacteriales bacterium]
MAKYKVLGIANSEETRIDLRRRLGKEEEIALVGFAGMNTDVLTKINGYAPHVVLLINETNNSGVMEIAQRIYQGFPGIAIVLLTQTNSPEVMAKAMQSGVRRVVSIDEIDELKDLIVQAAVFEQARAIETGREPRVVSVYGASGGNGTTTVAVNLAVMMAKSGRRVALLDLCLCYGDVDLLLNINAKDTIIELVQEKATFNIDDIKSFTMQHSSGLTVLCSPNNPKYAEYVTQSHVESIISVMRPYFDFIFIDLPCDLSDCTLTALESSDDILLITKRDIPNLRATKAILSILNTLQQQEKVDLVINADAQSVLSNADFERVLEIPIGHIIPEDTKTAKLCQERGEPYVTAAPRSTMTRAMMKVAKYCIRKDEKRS